MATGAELTYQTNASALAMANAIFGSGVTVNGASYSGPAASSAIYSNGQLADGVVPSETGVILSTGNVDDFTQRNGDPNGSAGTSTNASGTKNDSQFNDIADTNTYGAVWLDVDFTPTASFMTMSFVFASEEYPEYINSQFNDVIGVWVNGTHVPISVGNGVASVNNINGNTQQNLFVSNTDDADNIEMDGFTVTLTLTMPVNAGVLNSIRIGIADAADSSYDSNLLIAGDSVQTALVAIDDSINLNPNGTKMLDVLANDIKTPSAMLTITHINGVAVVIGSTITLPSGQTVTLNADGTFNITGDGQTETKNFTYTAKDSLGHTDIGFVNINSIPCFVAGTAIRTPNGEVAVETLRPGDLVLTQDDGLQPLRSIGRCTVAATGSFAPVHISAGTFGQHRDLMVSPLHRILIHDSLSELLFGETEVLVAARDLVNDSSVRYTTGGEVTYVHLLFDCHQVVFSKGLATQSFLPDPQTAKSFEAEILAEICAFFPEIDPETGSGYTLAARRTLRALEAQLLFASRKAA